MKKSLFTLFFISFCFGCIFAQSFTLASPESKAQVYIAKYEPAYLQLAVKDLVSDVKKITGKELQIVHSFPKKSDNVVVVATMSNKKNSKLLKLLRFNGSQLNGKWESSVVQSIRYQNSNILLVIGSDERGTMFGLYDFIEKYMEVDPLYFWSGREPQQRNSLKWDEIIQHTDEPSFKFRGWFINDEDLLTEWESGDGRRNIDYPFYSQVVTPNVMKHVMEALVRSRFNLIIPASFIDIHNPKEELLVAEAAKRGVFLSQHHIEPLGVSGYSFFNYWKEKGKDYKFSFYSHPDEMIEVWNVYAKKWSEYPNVIWQIGLRGVADRPMWQADPAIPESNIERGKIISDAMKKQIQILKKYDSRKEILATTTLWAEGSFLNNEGYLKIPENITIVFSDNNSGWKWQADFYSTKKELKNTYGVYYHHQLWGSGPHLAHVIPPQKTYEMLLNAYNNQANHYAVFNVSNVREFILGIDATSKMLWKIDNFNPDNYLRDWIKERFPNIWEDILDAYKTYYSSFTIHPIKEVPMFMDGQIVSQGTSRLKIIEDKILNPQKYDKMKVKTEPKTTDAFWTSVSELHPTGSNVQEMLQLLYPEKLGFNQVKFKIIPLLKELTKDQQQLLFDNLVYPNSLMLNLCNWLENIYMAELAVDVDNINACAEYLMRAVNTFSEIEKLTEKYCYGKWNEWYRGEKKVNLENRKLQTLKVLDVAKSKI